MGIFGPKDEDTRIDIDAFLNQRILTPKVFLTAAENEQYIRVYGQPKYADVRASLVEGEVPVKALYRVIFDGVVIGELSEFDRRAAEVLDFTTGNRYVARAVIQDDLIGCLVQLFVDPENKL